MGRFSSQRKAAFNYEPYVVTCRGHQHIYERSTQTVAHGANPLALKRCGPWHKPARLRESYPTHYRVIFVRHLYATVELQPVGSDPRVSATHHVGAATRTKTSYILSHSKSRFPSLHYPLLLGRFLAAVTNRPF